MSIRTTKWEIRFPRLHQYDQQLKLQDYKGELERYSSELCSTVLGKGLDIGICVREVKPVVDCIVRSKINKMGYLMDNISVCKAEIGLMKKMMEKEYGVEVMKKEEVFDKLDVAWNDLNYKMKSFI